MGHLIQHLSYCHCPVNPPALLFWDILFINWKFTLLILFRVECTLMILSSVCMTGHNREGLFVDVVTVKSFKPNSKRCRFIHNQVCLLTCPSPDFLHIGRHVPFIPGAHFVSRPVRLWPSASEYAPTSDSPPSQIMLVVDYITTCCFLHFVEQETVLRSI